jgi:hypothetical protein
MKNLMLIIVAMFLLNCEDAKPEKAKPPSNLHVVEILEQDSYRAILVLHDDKRNVTCYEGNRYGEAISLFCIKDTP